MRSRPLIPALAVLLAWMLAGAEAHAQVLLGTLLGSTLASPTFNMGFEVGVNFSPLDGFPESERMNKTVFGLFSDWRFSQHFHPGRCPAALAGRGATGLAPVAVGDPGSMRKRPVAGWSGASLRRNPRAVKWAPKRDEGFRMGAGPSLGIVTAATDRPSDDLLGTAYKLERDIADHLPDSTSAHRWTSGRRRCSRSPSATRRA
jgi:hypothetical protein